MLGNKTVLAHAAHAFLCHPRIHAVHIVVAGGEESRARTALGATADRVTIGVGGDSRRESVHHGLRQLAEMGQAPDLVLIHDAARPLISHGLIDRVLNALAHVPGACPALPVVDSLRRGEGDHIVGEIIRDNLWRAQTPQGFHFNQLLDAHEISSEEATDDVEILRRAGFRVRLVEGDARAMKITHASDFHIMEQMLEHHMISGTGFDVHRFGPGNQLWLCGIPVAHDQGLVGHSDADVGLHALTDAVLGALGNGDIGAHFPPSDPRWKGASSDLFLAHAASLVAAAGGRILHCDLTIIAEAPKIGPHRAAMIERVREILSAHRPTVSIKATTTEGLGFTGRGEGIAAQAVATIRFSRWEPNEF